MWCMWQSLDEWQLWAVQTKVTKYALKPGRGLTVCVTLVRKFSHTEIQDSPVVAISKLS